MFFPVSILLILSGATCTPINKSMPMQQVAVQVSGEAEICPMASKSISSFLQTKTSKNLRLQRPQSEKWNPQKPRDLHLKYGEIFQFGNRNAASHLWVSYIFDRARDLSHKQIKMTLSSFCAVSGSPVAPMAQSRYKAKLDKVGGGKVDGYTYHCCWPCICDTYDLIKTDTKSLTDKSGQKKEYPVLVIGDPCIKNPAKCTTKGEKGCLPYEAPELICEGGKLQGAHFSDKGHVIIGPFEELDPTHEADDYTDYENEVDSRGNSLKGACEARAETGYASGMGEIFRQVAMITPL